MKIMQANLILLIMIVGIIPALCLVGCFSQQAIVVDDAKIDVSTTEVPEPAPTETPENNDEVPKELVIALTNGSLNFDPAHAFTALEAQVYTAVFEGLVTYDKYALKPLPGIAQSWEISEDGKTYTFYLRDNATFSNGEKITAEDFRASWLRIINPDVKAEFSTFFDVIKGVEDYRDGKLKDTSKIGIHVIADYVLEIELVKPAAHFLNLLSHMSFVPLYKNYREDLKGNWARNSSFIGNGPFILTQQNASEIILTKNMYYWDSAEVGLERIIIRFYSDSKHLTEDFNQGAIHWAMDWDSDKLEDKSLTVVTPLFATSFLFFKSVDPPWNDARVRRALALLVPWEEIRNKEQVLFPTEKLVPYPDYPEVKSINKQNQEEALRLLSEAGFPEGKGLPAVVIRIQGASRELWAETLTKVWKEKLGITIKINEIESADYFKSLKQSDYTIGQMTWIGDFFDPLTFLQLWTSKSNLNDAGFSNEQYDKLIQDAISEKSKKRLEKFAEAESLLLSQAVVLPLSNQPALNLINIKHIEGWYPNLLDIHPLKYLRFKEPQVFPNLVRNYPFTKPPSVINF